MQADVNLDVKQGFMTLFLDTPPPLPPLRFALAFGCQRPKLEAPAEEATSSFCGGKRTYKNTYGHETTKFVY